MRADRATFSLVSSNVEPVVAGSRIQSVPIRLFHRPQQGNCDNLLTVRRDDLEAKVLDGLRDR